MTGMSHWCQIMNFRYCALFLLDNLFGKDNIDLVLSAQRKNLQKAQLKILSRNKTPKYTPIARVKGISPIQFRDEYFDKGIPVVLEGAAYDWKCVKEWDVDFFLKNYGDHEVLQVEMEGFTSKEKKIGYKWVNIKSILQEIKEGANSYLRISPLLHQVPILLADINTKWIREFLPPHSFAESYQLWIGGENAVTHLHADQPCNFNIQIYGQKKWSLIAPQFTDVLNPMANRTAIFTTDFNFEEPDYVKYPAMQFVDIHETILKPGDILYNPPFMWHHVKNIVPSISVGFRFSSVSAALKASPFLSLIRICATKPNLLDSAKLCKMDSNMGWAAYNGNLEEVMAKRPVKNIT